MSFPEGSAALRAASPLDRQPSRPRRSPSRTAAIEPRTETLFASPLKARCGRGETPMWEFHSFTCRMDRRFIPSRWSHK